MSAALQKGAALPCDMERLVEVGRRHGVAVIGISTRRGIMCSHREPAYAELALRQELPWSEQAQDECILLPLYPQMTSAEQEQVVAALGAACKRHLRAAVDQPH